jgi:O-antigen/teichoic acid export membrane protein
MIGCVIVIAFAPTILSVFETVTPAAVTSLRILAVAQAITVSTGPIGYLLVMSGHERLETLNTVGVAALNIGLNYVLVQEYQIVGAAIATGVSLSLYNVIRVWESHHFIGIHLFRTDYRNAVVPMFAGLLPVGVFFFLDWRSIPLVLLSGVCSLALFMISLRMLGLEDADRELLKSVQD